MNSCIRDVIQGTNVTIYNFVNLYGCKIGDNSKIGSFVEMQRGSEIGKCCKVSSHSFICEGVIIGNNVFIGHGVIFTNDKYPKVYDSTWEPLQTIVEDNVSIGSGAVILPEISIGENSVIGAGSVVTKDVLQNTIVIGNPARFYKYVTDER